MQPTTGSGEPIYRIEGGQALVGEVQLAGAKNAAGKLLLAALLTEEPSTIENVPESGEIGIALDIIAATGAAWERSGTTVVITPGQLVHHDLSRLPGKNRHPILLLGPLLRRTGKARVPTVGGDQIGARPINFHLEILRSLGASIEETPAGIIAEAKKLTATHYRLPYPSVGATETMLLAATWAEGTSVLEGGAIEPEVLQLVEFLQTMGAQIEIRDRTYTIQGVAHFGSGRATVIPDRLEAVSYAAAALATGGRVVLRHARADHLAAYLDVVRAMGARITTNRQGIEIAAPPEPLQAVDVRTGVYPGFATDYQQPTTVILACAAGTSVVHETVYTHRLGYTQDLNRLGALITVSAECPPNEPCRFQGDGVPHVATITGPITFQAGSIRVPDIRAGMAHVVAALAAEGISTIAGIDHLERGYDHLVEKLQALGARIRRED